jgi:predicted DNA-binding transcriptional regulator YafY
MPRPTARVLALLEILQGGGTRTAAELATRLSVDERTVRRYVQHLIDLDVPVWTERGRYGGFRLAPGYRMPPLMLTDDEAVAVVVGLLSAEQLTPTAAQSAAAKIRRVLPQRLGDRVSAMLDTVRSTTPATGSAPETEVLLLFAQAARDQRAVAIGYGSADGRISERRLHPYGVVAHLGRWYVTAADSASGQDRTFRLDRVRSAELLPDTFTSTADRNHDLLELLATAPRRHAVAVLVQADEQHIKRRSPPGLVTIEPASGSWVRVRLQVEELDWVPALLAWIDRPFVIEEPDGLRDQVRALAQRLLDFT